MLNQNFARANRCTGLGVGAGAGAELVPGWDDLVERVAPRTIAKITEIQRENMRLPVILGTLYRDYRKLTHVSDVFLCYGN